MALGMVIRKKRQELGFTLDEVSRRTGYSKPYLSTVETGRVRNPPSDNLLVKLEQVLGFDRGLLIQMAHMNRLPADLRQAVEHSQAENVQLRQIIRQVVEQGADVSLLIEQFRALDQPAWDNVQHLQTAGKLVPVINSVSAGYPVDFDDKGYPPGGADDYVRCPDLHDPSAFAVRVIGDSMEPKYRQGDIIVFSPSVEVRSGDDCFVRMSDPHETTFKQVFFEADGRVRLQPRNHKYSPLILRGDKINGLWRAVIRYEHLAE